MSTKILKKKATLDSMKATLTQFGSTLLKDPGTYTTKTDIRYMCTRPGCENPESGEMQYQSIINAKRAWCKTCSTKDRGEKNGKTQTGIPKVVKNPNKIRNTRKHTLADVKSMLSKNGATLLNGTEIGEKISTKTKVSFECECGSIGNKQVRDIDENSERGSGAYCPDCTEENRRSNVSKNKGDFSYNETTLQEKLDESNATLIKVVKPQKNGKIDYGNVIEFMCECGTEHAKTFAAIREFGALCKECIVKEPTYAKDVPDEIVCSVCNTQKPKSKFLYAQTTWKQQVSSRCDECRKITQARDTKIREKRQQAPVEKPDVQQKCTSCLKIFPIIDFNGYKFCPQCRENGLRQNKKLKSNIDLAKEMHPDMTLCMRCYDLKPSDAFMTDITQVEGVCCTSCREYVFDRLDGLADHLLALKTQKGPCVDCGEKDVKILEFDHIDRNNKICLVSACSTIEAMDLEASKCEMRCVICHIRRTKLQLRYKQVVKFKQAFVDNIKKEIGGCQKKKCGWYDESLLEALHFDHLDRTTKVCSVSEMVHNCNYTIDDIDKEILKCRCICAACHKKWTIKQLGYLMYVVNRGEARKAKIQKINKSSSINGNLEAHNEDDSQ